MSACRAVPIVPIEWRADSIDDELNRSAAAAAAERDANAVEFVKILQNGHFLAPKVSGAAASLSRRQRPAKCEKTQTALNEEPRRVASASFHHHNCNSRARPVPRPPAGGRRPATDD